MLETLITVATKVAIAYFSKYVGELIKRWGMRRMPKTAQAEQVDFDKEKIKETKELIKQCFGDNVTERFRRASNKERIMLMTDFGEKLVAVYGLDIDVDVTVSDTKDFGGYSWAEKKAEFNIALLMLNKDDVHFEYGVHETLDTIIHELRHAVQHKAMINKGFWNIDDIRRKEWMDNIKPGNYIRRAVDAKGYSSQPVEKDAFTFAALVMEGIK